jgi:hypothetical protein
MASRRAALVAAGSFIVLVHLGGCEAVLGLGSLHARDGTGGSTSTHGAGGSGGSTFACDTASSAAPVCIEYEGFTASEQPMLAAACTSAGGEAVSACPSANRLGTCTSTTQGVTGKESFYGIGGLTAAQAQTACMNMGGTWAGPGGCFAPPGAACSSNGNCCGNATCFEGVCCVNVCGACTSDADCCAGAQCGAMGSCCQPSAVPCVLDTDCCSGMCNAGTCG